MTYRWNAEHLSSVMAVPTAVADTALRLAGVAQLKVLLWFTRQGQFEAAACAKALGLSETDCRDAIQFWVELGLLQAEGEPDTSPETVTPCEVTALPPTEKAAPRPSFPEVVARQKNSTEFDYLLKTAEQRLGRTISPAEMETFLYIYDTVGLPIEVILMIVVYAVRNNKVKSRSAFRTYIEKVALSWSEQGIVTVAAAEAELCLQEQRARVKEHIQSLFGLVRPLTVLQAQAAIQWTEEWHISDELLQIAYEKCREKTGNFNANYISRILEGWMADGITTAVEARAALTPKKKSSGKPLLSDEQIDHGDEYERAAADWRPVYKKKAK